LHSICFGTKQQNSQFRVILSRGHSPEKKDLFAGITHIKYREMGRSFGALRLLRMTGLFETIPTGEPVGIVRIRY
jgi:hypothetical protein